MQEQIIQTKNCKHCNSKFDITNIDLEFYEKVSPVFGGKKYSIPSPTLCPDCRQQRRLSFRNERSLYKRKSDLSGKEIISIYSPDKPFKVFDNKEWWSDKWDAMEYGIDFDFNRSFFEQFNDFSIKIPKIGLYIDNTMENSMYVNYGQNSKNLYLCVNCYNLSDSYYSTSCFPLSHEMESNNIDCLDCSDSSNIYSCTSLKNSSNCFYSNDLEDCFECYFSDNLKGCSFCLFSTNKVNKEYLFLNENISKDVYEIILDKLLNDINFKKDTIQEYKILKLSLPHRATHNANSEDISGDYIINCKNVKDSYFVGLTENGKFLYTSGYHAKNMYDGMNCGGNSSYQYEILHTHSDYMACFLIDVDGSSNIYYSMQCYNSQYCFGCVGLRNKKYCIFNKQYTKEEYETLVPKIIEHMMKTGEWGEFFPVSISLFGYNDTVAQEYFELEKNEAKEKGFKWSDYKSPFPKVEKIITAEKIPDNIQDILDDILNWAIECEITKKPFRIIKQELEFYRKHNLPIPKRHPDQRHLDKMALRNSRKLFDRKCDKCGLKIQTTYSPDREEIVYCEKCYDREVY